MRSIGTFCGPLEKRTGDNEQLEDAAPVIVVATKRDLVSVSNLFKKQRLKRIRGI